MSRLNFRRYQFVWWGFRDMAWGKSHAMMFSSLRYIYDWSYCFGPLEIRRWKHD